MRSNKIINNNNVLIFGAGSIGNHMAFASRKLKLNVDITDISNKSLYRMKNKIFLLRYGKWDSKINLVQYNKVFKTSKNYDLIIIGTPPNTHFQVYNKIIKKLKFQNILIEKPLTHYLSKNYKKFNNSKYRIFCGYNHSLSPAFKYFIKILKNNKKSIDKIQVEWKEGWSGILKAHPWLKSEFHSYLGNMKKGGGALQEHSHGLHLLLLILNLLKIKLIKNKMKFFSIKKSKGKQKYDCYTNLTFISKKTFITYETDLISKNSKKRIIVETGYKKFILIFNHLTNIDAVMIKKNNKIIKKKTFMKSRSIEFMREIKHILKINKKDYLLSPINATKGAQVVNIIREIFNQN
jgi:predicted dehydrogenase